MAPLERSRYSWNFEDLVSTSVLMAPVTSGSALNEKPFSGVFSSAAAELSPASRSNPTMKAGRRADSLSRWVLMASSSVTQVGARRMVAAVDGGMAVEAGAVEQAVGRPSGVGQGGAVVQRAGVPRVGVALLAQVRHRGLLQ